MEGLAVGPGASHFPQVLASATREGGASRLSLCSFPSPYLWKSTWAVPRFVRSFTSLIRTCCSLQFSTVATPYNRPTLCDDWFGRSAVDLVGPDQTRIAASPRAAASVSRVDRVPLDTVLLAVGRRSRLCTWAVSRGRRAALLVGAVPSRREPLYPRRLETSIIVDRYRSLSRPITSSCRR